MFFFLLLKCCLISWFVFTSCEKFISSLKKILKEHFAKNQKQPHEVFCEKGVLKNFVNFTGKHFCWKLLHRCFPVNFAKYFLKHLFCRTSMNVCFSMLGICSNVSRVPFTYFKLNVHPLKGSFIQNLRKIFRKTTVSYPLILAPTFHTREYVNVVNERPQMQIQIRLNIQIKIANHECLYFPFCFYWFILFYWLLFQSIPLRKIP